MSNGRTSKLKIGVLLRAGLGDTVQLTAYIRGIKKQWPDSDITVFCRHQAVFKDNPDVAEFGTIKQDNWFVILQQNKHKYDIFYDLRYGGYAHYNNQNTPELVKAKRLQDNTFEEYRWLHDNFLVANAKLATINKPIWKIISDSINVDCTPDDMSVSVTKEEREYVSEFLEERGIKDYITVHDWAMFGKQTKCWMSSRWNEVIEFIRSKGVHVLQLGTKSEEPFDGTVNMLGRTSLHQTAAFLEKTKVHVDIEGGLVHVARAVGKKSIVLFGPTPENVFAYEDNKSIRSSTCSPCFWKRTNWHVKCMEGKDSICMKDITALQVIDAICEELGWDKPERPERCEDEVLRIGVERTGGIGDGAYAAAACAALKRKFPKSKITVYASPMTKKALVGKKEISELRDHVYGINPCNFDIYYDMHPDGGMVVNCGLAVEQARWGEVKKKFDRMKSDPSYAPNHLRKYNKTALEVINELFGLDAKLEDMQLSIPEADKRWAKKQVQGKKIVTIHDWAFGFRQTKCWEINRWATVTDWLTKRGFTVYQLGGRGEDIVPHTVSMLGKLSLTKSVALMLEGLFHIDNESSLGHYGAAFGHPTFVLIGPTMRYWRHDENYNILEGTCHGCEGYEGWTSKCPLNKNLECMKSITPEVVINHIRKFIDIREIKNPVIRRSRTDMNNLLVSMNGSGDVGLEELRESDIRLPYQDEQYSVVECDRVLEYLLESQVIKFLGEVRRVLKKDGVCKIRTLDLENLAQKYTRREIEGNVLVQRLLGNVEGNRYEYLMDIRSASSMLSKSGFHNIKNDKDPSGELLIMEATR